MAFHDTVFNVFAAIWDGDMEFTGSRIRDRLDVRSIQLIQRCIELLWYVW